MKNKIRKQKLKHYNSGKNNPSYIDGRYSKKHYCKEKDCLNEISYSNYKYGNKRCHSCENQRRYKLGIMYNIKVRAKISKTRIKRGVAKGKKNPMHGVHRFGKKNPSYVDGSTLKKYYCECGRQLKGTDARNSK